MLCVVKRNVQVMKKDVMSPGEVVKLICNLTLVSHITSYSRMTKRGGNIHCFLTSDWGAERSTPIISNGSGSPPILPFFGKV